MINKTEKNASRSNKDREQKINLDHLIYKCGGIDKRTIEK